MSRAQIARRIIHAEYLKLRESGDLDRVNVVRTVAVRVGYPLDKNQSHEFVRRVLKDFGLL